MFNYKGVAKEKETPSSISSSGPAPIPEALRPFIQKVLSDYLIPVSPDPVALGVMRAAADERTRAQDLAPLFSTNPEYRQFLFLQTFLSERLNEWKLEWNKEESKKEGEGEADKVVAFDENVLLDRILALLGKGPVRNLVACARFERLSGELEARKPGEKISVQPQQTLTFASAAEKLAIDRALLHPELAFNAGLHFDWIAALLKKRKAPADDRKALDAAFQEGLLIGKIGYELGKRIKEIRLGKYIFSAGLMIGLGRAMMGIVFPKSGSPSWAQFIAECEKSQARRVDRLQFRESKLFPVTHAEMASLMASYGRALREIELSLQFYTEPYQLRKSKPDHFQLAMLLSIASRVVSSKASGTLSLDAYHRTWLTSVGLTEAVLKTLS